VKATGWTVVIVASIIALALIVSVKKSISFISFNRYTCEIERIENILTIYNLPLH